MFGALGQAIGGGPTVTQQYYSKPVDNTISNTAGFADDTVKQANSDIGSYSAKLSKASDQIDAMAPGQLSQIGGVTNRLATTTGTGTFTKLGDYLTGKLGEFAKQLGQQGAAGNNLALANSGYGGTGPSSYTTDVMTNRISGNLSPVLSSIFNNLGGDTATVMGQDRANAGAVQGLQDYEASIPLRTPGLALAPTQARLSTLGSLATSSGKIADAAKTNSAGFRTDPSTGMLLGGAADSLVNTAIGAYTGGLAKGVNKPQAGDLGSSFAPTQSGGGGGSSRWWDTAGGTPYAAATPSRVGYDSMGGNFGGYV